MTLIQLSLVLILAPFAIEAQGVRAEEKKVLDTVLFGYPTQIRPNGVNDGPVQIEAQVYIRHISNFDPFRGELCLQATIREWWTDRRLSYNSLTKSVLQLNIRDHKLIWIPDTFVPNAIEQKPIDDNELIRIKPDGKVLYSRRLNLKLKCPTNIWKYPFDRQVCSITLASYGSTIDDLEYFWTSESDPLLLNDNLIRSNSNYEITTMRAENGTKNATSGEYSFIRLDLTLVNRSWIRTVILIYLPIVVLVKLAWLSFFLDPARSSARLMYCSILLLISVVLIHGYNLDPDRSQSKFIRSDDWWTGVGLSFVVFALLELFALNWTSGGGDGAVLTAQTEKSTDPEGQANLEPLVLEESSNHCRKYKLVGLRKISAQRLDQLCRVFYPILFCLWTLLYAICIC